MSETKKLISINFDNVTFTLILPIVIKELVQKIRANIMMVYGKD